jgi:putative FmdB family regulatory protein
MPLYEYECDVCGHRFEKIQKFSDPLEDKCPVCAGHVHKLQSSPAIQFKGSGFYITDYAKKDHTAAAKADRDDGGKPEKSESGDKSEKSEKSEKPEKSGKSEKSATSEKSESSSKADTSSSSASTVSSKGSGDSKGSGQSGSSSSSGASSKSSPATKSGSST